MKHTFTRRHWIGTTAAACAAAATARGTSAAAAWSPSYLLSSALYGNAPLADILPEVAKTGAASIDLWPRPHGAQREEVDSLGVDTVADLLKKHRVRLGGIACYRPGAFKLAAEFDIVRRLGDANTVLVTMAPGDGTLTGQSLDEAIRRFLGRLEGSIGEAERGGGVIAIENHANSLLRSPASIRRFAALVESEHIGLALAPHHLPQEANLLADLAGDTGPMLKFVYAQQHGKGSSQQLPKDDELLQLPGRGPLDFGPLMKQLAHQHYTGPVEIFMHPVPRGVPILPTIAEITAAVNQSRQYLDSLL